MVENTAETEAQLVIAHRQTVVIVSAQVFSVVVLLIVSFIASQIGGRPAATSFDSTALMVLIIFVAAASFVIRRLFNRWERYRNALLLGGMPGLLRTLKTNSIVLSTFAELIAVIGFVTTWLGGNEMDMIRAAAVAIIVFAINFPRRSVWEKIVWNLHEL